MFKVLNLLQTFFGFFFCWVSSHITSTFCNNFISVFYFYNHGTSSTFFFMYAAGEMPELFLCLPFVHAFGQESVFLLREYLAYLLLQRCLPSHVSVLNQGY